MGSVPTLRADRIARKRRARQDRRARKLSSKVTVRLEDPLAIAQRIAQSPDREAATWLGQNRGIGAPNQ